MGGRPPPPLLAQARLIRSLLLEVGMGLTYRAETAENHAPGAAVAVAAAAAAACRVLYGSHISSPPPRPTEVTVTHQTYYDDDD